MIEEWLFPDPITRDVLRIKESLRNPEIAVKMECFNLEEVNLIKEKLTEAERQRVFFTWLVFGET